MLTKKSSSIIKKILIITILVAAAMTLAFVRGRMLVVRNYSVPGLVILETSGQHS